MTRPRHVAPAVLVALGMALPIRAASADTPADAAIAVDAGADDAANTTSGDAIPLACDGSLCDTTVGSLCDVSRVEAGTVSPGILAVTAATALVLLSRRRRRSSRKESVR